MRTSLRTLFAAILALFAIVPALAQSPYPPGPPPPVPTLPDSQRQTTHTITSTTCACAVGFQLYGTGTDYQNWIEVWLNGKQVQYNDPVYGWSIASPTGALSVIPRPITDAVLTFNNAQTGTVVIVGAERPRRLSEFSEGQGVTARAQNQTFNDLYAINREVWDKANDLTGRGFFFAPGNTTGPMPTPAQCANAILGFDGTGLNPQCQQLVSAGGLTTPGSTTNNDVVIFNSTNGKSIGDSGVAISNVVRGPGSSTSGQAACWNGTTGNLLQNCAGAGARIKLTTATTFYVDPVSGVDQSGCGLAAGASACNTRQYLANILYANYDAGGQTITVQLAHGTYTHGLALNGLISGQTGPSGLIFQGDCSSAANTKLALISPTVQANSYALANGAAATIQCQKIDHSNILSVFGGADMVSVGQGSSLTIGDAALYCPSNVCANGYADMTFGCNINQWNDITVAFHSYALFVNDFNIDPTSCQVSATGSTTASSNTITSLSTTSGLVQYMGIAGANIPTDAFVNSFTSSTVTFACIYTSPCQASATGSSISFAFFGGGQDFLDLGNGSQAYFNTNGDPSFSIIANLASYNYFLAGFIFDNDLSAANAGGITFAGWGFAHGGCVVAEGLSVFTSYGEGVPYIPCNATAAIAAIGGTTTAGSTSVSVVSSSALGVGQVISEVAAPTATWTAGSPTITVSSASTIIVGQSVLGAGILSGAKVTGISGTTITLGGCTSGPRCVSGNPTYLSETSSPVYFKGGCLASGTKITAINSSTSITISQPAKATCSGVNIWANATASDNSIYQ